jgi:hypothetical protein
MNHVSGNIFVVNGIQMLKVLCLPAMIQEHSITPLYTVAINYSQCVVAFGI